MAAIPAGVTGARASTAILAVLVVATPLAAAQTQWVEHATLIAEDPEEGARFGATVAVDGTTVAVGSPARSDPGSAAGAVHLFERTDGSFDERPMLRPADIQGDDRFGSALALDGDTLVVGSPEKRQQGLASGAAYVFTRSGGSWSQQTKLAPSGLAQGDRFGAAVALDGDTLVVGAPTEDDPGQDSGAAYVYARSDGSWSRQAKLDPGDLKEGDRFGSAVAVEGAVTIVTAPAKDATAELAGVAYAFTRSGGSWSREARFQPDDVAEADIFGNGADLEAGTALISATGDDDPRQSGAAYLFDRDGGSWSQKAKLKADDATAGDALGSDLTLDGSTALLGAPGRRTTATQAGAAVVFDLSGSPSHQATLNLSSPETGDRFGAAVGLDAGWALVGAPGADGGADDAGRVTAFGPPGAGGGGNASDGNGPVTPAAGVPAVVAVIGVALLVRRR